MIRKYIFLILVLFCNTAFTQYVFKGQLAEKSKDKAIYLSIIEDYRKLNRISMEQILKKTTTDSLGNFRFSGNNLLEENRIYRIHVDECSVLLTNSEHFFESCEFSKSILFIANNKDTINFPTSFADEALCKITSTNEKSSAFLQIAVLKEEMAFDFNDFRSNANRKLNSKKWFSNLQEFGKNLNEPLAELYIFDFLSDKRNDTYTYYLKDLIQNNYYSNLGKRLKTKYPKAPFTNLYIDEIAIDQFIASKQSPGYTLLKWLLPLLLLLSLGLNGYLLLRNSAIKKKKITTTLNRLTEQEQKVVNKILLGKTNKEIASELFISVSTVKTHINNLYKKLEVTSRKEIKQRFS